MSGSRLSAICQGCTNEDLCLMHLTRWCMARPIWSSWKRRLASVIILEGTSTKGHCNLQQHPSILYTRSHQNIHVPMIPRHFIIIPSIYNLIMSELPVIHQVLIWQCCGHGGGLFTCLTGPDLPPGVTSGPCPRWLGCEPERLQWVGPGMDYAPRGSNHRTSGCSPNFAGGSPVTKTSCTHRNNLEYP